MPKYKYIVINAENKQLNGTISSNDESSARQQLNDLGFSVVSMSLSEENLSDNENALPVFEFAGIDKNQKRVIGTIEAADRFGAYKRLVNEYAFEIEYVIENTLDERDKVIERKKGAYSLQEELNKELNTISKKQTTDEKDLEEFQQKQNVLKLQIEFVLKKVKEILDLYEQKLTPETKEKIRQYVDKILRIKTSTNLDYVRKTAEELLEFLQKEEIFLNESTQEQERTKMVLEAKNMMMQLHKSDAGKSTSLKSSIIEWAKKVQQDSDQNILTSLLIAIISRFINLADENPDIVQLKADISSTNQQIVHYIQLYLQAPNEQFKIQTKAELIILWKNRKNLKQKLKDLNLKLKAEINAKKPESELLETTVSFSGWLMAFYMVYYFIALYATSKNLTPIIETAKIPAVLNFYKSTYIKYFFCTLFLLHSSLSIKRNFFQKNQLANVVITPIFIVGTLIIFLNF